VSTPFTDGILVCTCVADVKSDWIAHLHVTMPLLVEKYLQGAGHGAVRVVEQEAEGL
jgi:hypothetical protein